jgi:hypothetical protein
MNKELWMMYLNYMEEKNKVNSVKLEFYERALKNVSDEHDIWISLMREYEKAGRESTYVYGKRIM